MTKPNLRKTQFQFFRAYKWKIERIFSLNFLLSCEKSTEADKLVRTQLKRKVSEKFCFFEKFHLVENSLKRGFPNRTRRNFSIE